MAYAQLSENELRAELTKRDKELADARKKSGIPGTSNNQPQMIFMAPSIPLPAHWNLKVKDITESFKDFKKSWSNYLQASSVSDQPDPVKVGVFWAAIGLEAMKKCDDEWNFTDQEKLTVDSIIGKIDSKLSEERIPIIDRIRFQECKRDLENGESIADFVERAEKLVDYCQFGEKRSELLLQQILVGMRDLDFQKDLVSMKKLDWKLAKQMILARKNRDSQLEALNPIKPDPESVKAVKIDKKQKKCKYCGLIHQFDKKKCPAFGKTCDYCKKSNHFKSVCKQKARDEQSDDSDEEEKESPAKKKSTKKPGKVKKIEEYDSSDSETFTIRKTSSEKDGVFAIVKMKVDDGWKLVRCQMDTGSDCNLIGLQELKKLIKDPVIRKTSYKLQDIQKKPIRSIGECGIRVFHRGMKYKLMFQVVDLEHHPLLSENACRVLQFIKYGSSVGQHSANHWNDGKMNDLNHHEKCDQIPGRNSDMNGLISLKPRLKKMAAPSDNLRLKSFEKTHEMDGKMSRQISQRSLAQSEKNPAFIRILNEIPEKQMKDQPIELESLRKDLEKAQYYANRYCHLFESAEEKLKALMKEYLALFIGCN